MANERAGECSAHRCHPESQAARCSVSHAAGAGDHVTALWQRRADGQEDAELGSSSIREDGVQAILDTLQEMEGIAEASLPEVRTGESDAQLNGALLKQGLGDEITPMEQEKDESIAKSASTAQALAQAQKDPATEKIGSGGGRTLPPRPQARLPIRRGPVRGGGQGQPGGAQRAWAAKAILLKNFAAFVATGSKTHARLELRDDASDDARCWR